MAKSRSNTMAEPSFAIAGQSTRPSLKWVTWVGWPPATGRRQMFSEPDWSLM